MKKHEGKTFCEKLKYYVDGEADTFFEYFMLLVVFVNTATLGFETSPSIEAKYSDLLFWIDQICLYIFVFELFIKVIAYNCEFFGEMRTDEEGEKFFHINKMKTLKLINGITSLRVMVKAIIKAFPSVLWTFFLLLIFAYVYAIIGTNIFSIDFPEYFGSLKLAFFSLFGLIGVNSSAIIARFSWAWVYFVSYNFFEASIIMNVIVGVIVDAVNDSRKEIDEESNKSEVTLESIAKQLEELNRKFDR